MSASVVTAHAVLAKSCTGECQKSGPLGLLVILVLCIACYFLFKSMSRHLKRVRDDFPADPPPAATGTAQLKRQAISDGATGGAAPSVAPPAAPEPIDDSPA